MNSSSRKETERNKLIQEKCQTLLMQMLRDEDNKYCVDCDSKGPRWASWNLGVFLCIRCAGIHRNLGVHISRVKSVNLDTWTPEQVISLQQMGNSRARAVYEAQLPDGFRRPQTDSTLEPFIRAKYEHKKYLAREWVPPSPPKVDWGKEIEEELEKQKRKKKSAALASVTGGVISNTTKSTPLPAPLPKPKAGQSGSSPKTQRISIAATTAAASGSISNNASGSEATTTTNDLLGLSSPTKPSQTGIAQNNSAQQDLQNDSFSSFLSAPPTNTAVQSDNMNGKNDASNQITDSLAKEEEDFFNQGSLGNINGSEKDKSGKLTKDSILALYGTAPTNTPAHHNPLNPQPQLAYGQSQQMFGATGAFASLPPHPQQPQYMMTPPNSASMFNTPVMTAPAAFSTGYHSQFQNLHSGMNTTTAFQQQPQQMGGLMGLMPSSNAAGNVTGLGGTNNSMIQPLMTGANVNLMHTNQSLLSGMSMLSTTASGQQQLGLRGAGHSLPLSGGMASFPTTNNAAPANLNQQFGNLNIGNVWQ